MEKLQLSLDVKHNGEDSHMSQTEHDSKKLSQIIGSVTLLRSHLWQIEQNSVVLPKLCERISHKMWKLKHNAQRQGD